MEITAKLNNLRVAPRKVRIVADMIRGKEANQAQIILHFTVNKSALHLKKLLDSALANAKNNFKTEGDFLISKITVDEGPKLKRWMPRARGSAFPIQKKTSHITLILETIEGRTKKIAKKTAKRATEKPKEALPSQEPDKATTAGPEHLPPLKPKTEFKMSKPKIQKGIRRFFQRKAV